ncbi:hypothetical protein ACYSNW_04560 [Enterococcus sp. LJL99]
MRKKVFLASLILCFVLIVGACSSKKEADYSVVEAEKLLNEGEDLDGKTVEITVDKLAPNSAFGYNIQTGEHLNFVSDENPNVKESEILIVKIKSVKSVMGSFIVKYELVDRLDSPTKTKNESNNTSESSSSELSEENYFKKLIKNVPSVNKDNYNQDDYQLPIYKDLLRNPNEFIGSKINLINAEIIQVTEEGDFMQYLLMPPTNDIYIAIIEKSRLETKLLEDDTIHLNGQFLGTYKYINKANDEKEVPLIYTNAYTLLE